MLFRAGCLLLLLATLFAFGCREPLTPNVDRNFAPETWITAAPQDTITFRNEFGQPVTSPIGTVSVRFRVYWAGSDPDGEIAGFFYAVVETVPQPPIGFTEVPSLPGPKPQDYRFTTRTDSTFLFSVSEFSPDRQHAFFIYAVDNQGKPDPTPARVIFNALDRFPPLPVIPLNGGAKATGRLYRMDSSGNTIFEDRVFFINDSLTLSNLGRATTDTVPRDSRLDFNWRGEPTIAGVNVSAYRYKLDETAFNTVGVSVTSASYNTRIGNDYVSPGSKVFTLRAIDEAGGAREVTRRFRLNYDPDTWFSGPDPNQPIYQTDPVTGERYYQVPGGDWSSLPALPGSYLACDSLRVRPGARPLRRTFFEFYKDRIYVRSENDTVHMNSWVLFHNGGSDKDSPYSVEVSPVEPELLDSLECPGPAWTVRPAGPTGSALGFRALYLTFLAPSGPVSRPSQSNLYPLFDPASVFRSPNIGSYRGVSRAGKVYVLVRAEDGDKAADSRILDPQILADKVDRGDGTPAEIELRSKVMTFYVDKPPELLIGSGGFVPNPGDTFFTRTLSLNLLAADRDPYDLVTAPPSPGGPSSASVFRYWVRVVGKTASGSDTTVVVPGSPKYLFTPSVTVNIPNNIVSRNVTIQVELCDCTSCELTPGTGRCVNYSIPVVIPPPPAASEGATSAHPPTGPGSSSEVRRAP